MSHRHQNRPIDCKKGAKLTGGRVFLARIHGRRILYSRMGSGERAWAGGGITFWVFLARTIRRPSLSLPPPAGKWSVASSVSRIQIGVTKAKSVPLLQSGEKHRFQKPMDRFLGIDADADGQAPSSRKPKNLGHEPT